MEMGVKFIKSRCQNKTGNLINWMQKMKFEKVEVEMGV